MEFKYFCYRHIRLDKNEPFYIGVGIARKSINSRYRRAFDLKNRNNLWHKIYAKNIDNISIEIIYESNDRKETLNKEREFIKLYGRIDLGLGSLSNLTDGGEGFVNMIRTKEHKKKTSQTLMGHSVSDATKQKIKEARKLQAPPSEKTKRKLSKANKGRNKGISFFERINEVGLKKHKKQWRVVLQICPKTNETIKEYFSLSEAARQIGSRPGDICTVCTGKQKTAKGFKWAYK